MPTCKFCRKQYDVNDSSANNYKQYCSRSCELRGISAAKDRENALIAAEAADDQARAYYEAADAAREQADAERERADAEYERANAEYERANAEREKAKAYDRLRKSNERIEEERKAEEKKQRELELIREDFEDKCGMFVTRKIWDEEGKELEVRVREATGGTREYKLGVCEIESASFESHTVKNGKAEIRVRVNTLLNKTPKGTGPLRFCIYCLLGDKESTEYSDAKELDEYGSFVTIKRSPFIKIENPVTGVFYWEPTKIESDYMFHDPSFVRVYFKPGKLLTEPIYKSKEFSLKKDENIEDKIISLTRTSTPFIDYYFSYYLVLEEKTIDKTDYVAWAELGDFYGLTGLLEKDGKKARDNTNLNTYFGSEFWDTCKIGEPTVFEGGLLTNDFTYYKDEIDIKIYGFKNGSTSGDCSGTFDVVVNFRDKKTDTIIHYASEYEIILDYTGRIWNQGYLHFGGSGFSNYEEVEVEISFEESMLEEGFVKTYSQKYICYRKK